MTHWYAFRKKKNNITFRTPGIYSEQDFTSAVMVVVSIILCALILSCSERVARAEEYTDAEIVSAIWTAEGGRKASKPYGIMLKKCSWDNIGYCELACYQTIRNNRKRYAEWGHKSFPDYLSFLQSRYAPTENATNDPLGLNSNWLRNVRSILERNRR